MTDPPWMVLFLTLIVHLAWTLGEELNESACLQNGFSPNLMCISCHQLGQFKLERLTEGCMQCCQQDADSSGKKYPYAELRVCQ